MLNKRTEKSYERKRATGLSRETREPASTGSHHSDEALAWSESAGKGMEDELRREGWRWRKEGGIPGDRANWEQQSLPACVNHTEQRDKAFLCRGLFFIHSTLFILSSIFLWSSKLFNCWTTKTYSLKRWIACFGFQCFDSVTSRCLLVSDQNKRENIIVSYWAFTPMIHFTWKYAKHFRFPAFLWGFTTFIFYFYWRKYKTCSTETFLC